MLVAPGTMVGPVDEPEPVLSNDPIERRYVVRELAFASTRRGSEGESFRRIESSARSAV
jgi:hypothetical protein